MVKEGRLGLYPAVGNCCILRSHDGQQRLQRSFLCFFRHTSPHVSPHLFFKWPDFFLSSFTQRSPNIKCWLSCHPWHFVLHMMSVRAMPVHGHCRPNQPDDVLTFSKNHLCVYKELPLLHNRLMHIPASAWIFGSKSNRLKILYLLLRRHWRRALFGPSLHLGFLPTRCALWTIGTNTIWLFGTNTIEFEPLLVARKDAFWKNYMHQQRC